MSAAGCWTTATRWLASIPWCPNTTCLTEKRHSILGISNAFRAHVVNLAELAATARVWNQPITAFRFFTVYGPWGRPDLAPFKCTDAALKCRPIDVHNHGEMSRDFTYIDDLVESIVRLIGAVRERSRRVGDFDSLSPVAPDRLVNIGGGTPVSLMAFIEAIETSLGQQIERNYMDIQPGDIPKTWVEPRPLEALTGYKPDTSVQVGVALRRVVPHLPRVMMGGGGRAESPADQPRFAGASGGGCGGGRRRLHRRGRGAGGNGGTG